MEEGRNKVLKKVEEKHFPAQIIASINEQFDKKGKDGWLYTLNGGSGQILRVYQDYLIIHITSSFNEEEMEVLYRKLLKKENGSVSNELLGIGSAMLGELTHLRNPLRAKNMAKIASHLVVSKINSAVNNSSDKKSKLNVQKGERKINFREFDSLGLRMPEQDEEKGFLVIRNKIANENGASDLLFFFNNSSSIKKKIKIVVPVIEENLRRTQSEKYHSEMSVADQLRELKALLDEKIITEEDFEKKKKQLLDL